MQTAGNFRDRFKRCSSTAQVKLKKYNYSSTYSPTIQANENFLLSPHSVPYDLQWPISKWNKTFSDPELIEKEL